MSQNKKQVVDDPLWSSRIEASNRYYKKWETLFKCDTLEKYYEGQQWVNNDTSGYMPYSINKFFETIQIKIAQFIPTFPKYLIYAKDTNAEKDLEAAGAAANLKQDALNTCIQDNRRHFRQELEMAYKDSFFRFGIIEVGYSADWILNPNAPKPLYESQAKENSQTPGYSKPKILQEPDELPANERIYFKHIGAKRFRVGGVDNKYLGRCSWVGYYEWVYKDDLLSLKGIINRDKIANATPTIPSAEVFTDFDEHENQKYNAVKIWHIWDIRSKNRLIVLDSPNVTIYQKKYKRLPLFDYRPDRRTSTEGFYPAPPAFNWISPQDEINETREQLRKHRRRFTRKFQIVEGQIDDEEIEKFEDGPDGGLIKVKRENSITPIENANLGAENSQAMVTSADDLNKISGTSSEARGVADRTTATQAQIIQQRAGIRETKERDLIVDWLSDIGREALLTMRDKYVIGMWVHLTSNINEQFLGAVQQTDPVYTWVSAEDLADGYDFRIDVDVTSLSENAMQDEQQKFVAFLALVTQYPAISFSPLLIREAAYRVGYRNEAVIKELQKMALMQEMGRQAQMQEQMGAAQGAQGAGNPGGGNPAAQQLVQQMTPPNQDQTRQQIQNQVPGVH